MAENKNQPIEDRSEIASLDKDEFEQLQLFIRSLNHSDRFEEAFRKTLAEMDRRYGKVPFISVENKPDK